jgi:hypothetical protein
LQTQNEFQDLFAVSLDGFESRVRFLAGETDIIYFSLHIGPEDYRASYRRLKPKGA